MTKAFFSAALFALLLSPQPLSAQSTDPSGLWLTENGNARIRVSRCGDAYCGTIAALTQPLDRNTGQPQLDSNNPNPALARRPLVGVYLFSNMRPSGPSKWSGHIYNAKDGKTYDSSIAVTGPTVLRVEGCVIGICGGENWSRIGR